ncbi:MAG: cytochrome ubiquinol oxidase subunit I, partial [Pseudomonas sp.]
DAPIAILPLIASGVLLSLAVLVFRRAVSRLRQGTDAGLQNLLWLAAGLGLVHVLLLIWVLVAAPLTPSELAHDAVLTVMLYYLLFHGGLASIFTALQAVRVRMGYVALRLPYEPVVVQPFWMYTLGVFWMSFAAFILLPMAWGGA